MLGGRDEQGRVGAVGVSVELIGGVHPREPALSLRPTLKRADVGEHARAHRAHR